MLKAYKMRKKSSIFISFAFDPLPGPDAHTLQVEV
jgi:hypothetical protein